MQSYANNNKAAVPTLFFGDVVELNITFLEGINFASFVGTSNYEIKVAIGNLSTREILTQSTLDGDGKAVLDLSTNAMALEMYQAEQKTLTLEIQISYANQKTETLCQVPCTVQNQLIGVLVIPSQPLSVFAQSFEIPSKPINVAAQNMDARTTFLSTDIGRQFIALQTKTPRGLVEGETYTINSINTLGGAAYFDVTSGLGAVNYVHRGIFFEFV